MRRAAPLAAAALLLAAAGSGAAAAGVEAGAPPAWMVAGREVSLLACTAPPFELLGTPAEAPRAPAPGAARGLSAVRVRAGAGDVAVVTAADTHARPAGVASSAAIADALGAVGPALRDVLLDAAAAPPAAVRRAVAARPLASLRVTSAGKEVTRTGQYAAPGMALRVDGPAAGGRGGETVTVYDKRVRLHIQSAVASNPSRAADAAGSARSPRTHLRLSFERFPAAATTESGTTGSGAARCHGPLVGLWGDPAASLAAAGFFYNVTAGGATARILSVAASK